MSSRPSSRALTLAVALLIGVPCVLAGTSQAKPPWSGAAVVQPPQPKSGPGGRAHSHRGIRVTAGGSGNDAWFAFEPTGPQPRKTPLAIVMHGYFAFSGYDQMFGLISHTVRRGSTVIYPLWQTGIADPCPGPFDIEPCMTSAVNGIRGALAYLRSSRKRVQPDLRRTSYFGFSFGGIITANLANRYRSLGLPRPRAIFLDDPHDGGLAGPGEPALDDSLAGIPPSVRFECHSGAEGVISEPGKQGSSCNAVFPKLGQIPAANKDLVLTHTDTHGQPTLSSAHGVCAGGGSDNSGTSNAYDWNFCWKVWDALRSCAYSGKNCRYALGNTPQHRSLGRWSDGTPVIPLKIQNAAPIAP
jgi:pimeloyl-ACP methyl ester carboxylesterase